MFQCSFEKAIKEIQQREPLGTNIKTMIKTNLIKNFGLDIENQFSKSTTSNGFTSSTKSINAIGSFLSTSIFGFIKNIGLKFFGFGRYHPIIIGE